MTFLHTLGYLTVDQERLAPRIDRAIDARVIGAVQADSGPAAAIAAVFEWLDRGEQAGRIALDFPRVFELMAACAVETHTRYLRTKNSAVMARAAQTVGRAS